jgi:hypothetical protein
MVEIVTDNCDINMRFFNAMLSYKVLPITKHKNPRFREGFNYIIVAVPPSKHTTWLIVFYILLLALSSVNDFTIKTVFLQAITF